MNAHAPFLTPKNSAWLEMTSNGVLSQISGIAVVNALPKDEQRFAVMITSEVRDGYGPRPIWPVTIKTPDGGELYYALNESADAAKAKAIEMLEQDIALRVRGLRRLRVVRSEQG